ncbi:Uncharacterised protein [BD1-7 clade bacterium]|uniref:protein O-GlcNAc transferase n=1 Tax=BD1-7 clade bacterium TaxID=2029982 RepID=A0A5S9PZ98_9GAMM|nr:Uncharacterised protein [BD1-7 clade bacterium]CAA0112948.1 Uncharacterised protein [BD1-7 clade bacterium]
MNTDISTPIQRLLSASAEAFAQRDNAEADALLHQILALDPKHVEALTNLAFLSYRAADYDASIKWADEAIRHDIACARAYSHKGIALMAKQQMVEALQILEAGSHQPEPPAELWINLGLAYQTVQQFENARHAMQRGIAMAPTSAEGRSNLGSVFQTSGQIDQALVAYQGGLDINPMHLASLSNYLMCLQYTDNTNSFQLKSAAVECCKALEAHAMRQASADSALLHPLGEHAGTNTDTLAGTTLGTQAKRPATDQILRIGFVSGDFRQHPVGWFFIGILRALTEHGNVETYCYQTDTRQDELTTRLQSLAHQWRYVLTHSDNDVVEMIRRDRIDVLIDLAGHTAGNRVGVFAQRPARLQYSWLGYPASVGLSAIDGVVLGQYMVNRVSQCYFSEPLIVLDAPQFCYTPPDYLPDVKPSPVDANGQITFGCFNNIAKLNDSVLRCYAALLHQVPNSQLILKWKSFADPNLAEAVLKRFHAMGIVKTRLQLRGASPHIDMLNEYADVDIALDPFPFSGGLTSYEATWMGVPVITLYGHRPLSRQTYAINQTLGFPQRCATNVDEYIACAKKLVTQSGQLTAMRFDLRQHAESSALTNHGVQADELLKSIRLSNLFDSLEQTN